MFAVKSSLVSNIVRRADRASSMAAFEATFMVWSSIHSNLFCWINSVITAKTFISGSTKHASNLVRCRFLAINRFLWFYDLRRTFKAFVKTTSPLKELIKVWPAIKHSLKGIVVAELESSFAMVASETGFVVDAVISGQLFDEIDGFFTSHTFLSCACKCHGFGMFFTRRMKISSSLWRLQWNKWALFRRMGG